MTTRNVFLFALSATVTFGIALQGFGDGPKLSPHRKRSTVEPDAIATALAGRPIYRNAVRSVAFSPDGKHLAIGCGDGGIRIWDVGNRKMVRTILAHLDWAFDLTFTPDGILVSGGGDDLVKLIDLTDGKTQGTFHDHTNDLHGVAVSPNGEWLVSGSDDTRVLQRSLKSGKLVELGRHEKQVTSVAISPDGKWAASSSRDHTVRLWDLAKQKFVRDFALHDADVLSVAFSPDSSRIVTGSYDRTARVWDLESGKQLSFLPKHGHRVYTVLFTKDGKGIFTGGADRTFRFFQTTDGKLLHESQLSGDLADFAMSPDGKLLATGLADGSVRFFRIDGLQAKLLPEEIHVLLEANSSEVAEVAGEPLSVFAIRQYLQQHRRLLVIDEGWSKNAAKLNPTGDAFTLFVLKKVDEKKLRPDQAELKMRVIQSIEQRRGKQPENVQDAEWGIMLARAAYCDLRHERPENQLAPWINDRLREQSTDETTRHALQGFRDKTLLPEEEDDFGALGFYRGRIREYIDLALAPSKKPSAAEKTSAPQK